MRDEEAHQSPPPPGMRENAGLKLLPATPNSHSTMAPNMVGLMCNSNGTMLLRKKESKNI